MNTEEIKKGILHTSQNTLKKYEGKKIGDVIKDIRSDLNDVINNYLENNNVYANSFPIEFENELVKWKINADGTTDLESKKTVEYIEIKMTILPNSTFEDET